MDNYDYIISKNNCKYLIFVCLASIQFYQPNFINVDGTLWKFIYYSSILLMAVAVFKNRSEAIVIEKNKCLTFITAFIICQIISIYNVSVYKGQPIIISIVSTLQYIGFIAYILLCKSNITISHCEKVISIFAWTFVVLSILNMISVDALFGNYEFDVDRGGMRYRLHGLGWVVLYCLQNVNKYLEERKTTYIWVALTMYIFIVLSLTRQAMAITMLMIVLMIMYNVKFYQKVLLILIMLFSAFYILPKVPIYNKMMNLTNEQMNADYDNIRIVAFSYYGFEYPRNVNQVLFGVGVPSFGKSTYGNEIDNTEQDLKIYTSDVGYIDIYFKFGIMAIVFLLLSQIVCLRRKTMFEYLYAKYYLGSYMLLAIASTPYFSDTLSICVALYILSLKSSIQE